MASRSMLGSVANGFAAATVAVAVAGEAIALVTKAKEDKVRPQGSPVWSDYLKPGEKISEILASRSSRPYSSSSDTSDPVQQPVSGPTDGAKSDPFPLVDRDTYISSDDACELLANVRTTARPHMRPLSYRIVKRGFDLAFSSAVIVAGAVPAALLCAAISLDSPGEPIYTQRRVARLMPDGTFRTFQMFKFRTMVEDADAQLENLQELNDADGPMFKIKDDPRVTRIGSYLRVHSFDELPQFVNVLTGDMSAVGPRPTADIHLPMLARHPYRCSSRLGVSERARLHSASIQPSGLSSSVSASWETGCGGDGSVSGRCAPLPIGAIRHLLD